MYDYMGDYGMYGSEAVLPAIPFLPEAENLNLSDGIVGALGSQVALRLAAGLVEKKWPEKAHLFNYGVGALALGGLFVESLRMNSFFLGFSVSTIPIILEPLVAGIVNKVGPVIGMSGMGSVRSNAYRNMTRRVGRTWRQSARVGQSGGQQGVSAVFPSIHTPRSLMNTRRHGMAGSPASKSIAKALTRR